MPDSITIFGSPQVFTDTQTGAPQGLTGGEFRVYDTNTAVPDNFGQVGHPVDFLLPTDYASYNHARLIVTGTWTQSINGIAQISLGTISSSGIDATYMAPISRDWIFLGTNALGGFPMWCSNFAFSMPLPGTGPFYEPLSFNPFDSSTWVRSYRMRVEVVGDSLTNSHATTTVTFAVTRTILQLWKTTDPGVPSNTVCIGACNSFYVTPGAASGTSGNWSVTDGGGTVASNGSPNGWTVSYSGGVLTVCAPCGATAETVTVTYQIDSGHNTSISITLIDCSLCGGAGGGGGAGAPARSAIENIRERGWLVTGAGNTVRGYNLADMSPLWVSSPYSIDTWCTFRYDRRRALLAMLSVHSGVYAVWASTDGGNTATSEVSVTANSAVLECDSERGSYILLWGDSSDNVNYQISTDGCATWSSAAAVQYNGSQLTAKLMDSSYDARQNILSLVCQISGDSKILKSQDRGETFSLAL